MDQQSNTAEKLQALKTGLERLLRSYRAVQQENELLKQQIEAVRRSVHDKNKRIESLEEQMELQRTASSIASISQMQEGSGDKEGVRKRINDLIKEVDNCIALLNE